MSKLEIILLILLTMSWIVNIACLSLLKDTKPKKKHISKEPTHWTLSWNLTMELGFDDGTYLPRKVGLILYPQYFDKNGEPKKDMLPIDKN